MTAINSQGLPTEMHTDLVHLAGDAALVCKIMKKRQEEMQRRAKLLDPRKRQLGVDPAVLDAQVAEKRSAQGFEAAEDAYYAQQGELQERVLQAVEQQKVMAHREKQKQTIEYSLAHLTKEQRHLYSLSDPKEYVSVAITHPEDQLGPCSMTKFEGQALVGPARKKELQEQQAAWLKPQIEEKKQREQAEKDWDKNYYEQVAKANLVRAHLEQATEQEAKEEKMAEAMKNLEIAKDRRQRDLAKLERDRAEAQQHAETIQSDERMMELHDWKLGSNGKLVRWDYKRLSVDEQLEFYSTSAQLLREKRRASEEEKAADAEQALSAGACSAVLSAVEAEKARRVKERTLKVVEANRELAATQREKRVRDNRAKLSFDHEP